MTDFNQLRLQAMMLRKGDPRRHAVNTERWADYGQQLATYLEDDAGFYKALQIGISDADGKKDPIDYIRRVLRTYLTTGVIPREKA